MKDEKPRRRSAGRSNRRDDSDSDVHGPNRTKGRARNKKTSPLPLVLLVGGGILLVVISVVVVRISHRSTESEPTAEFVPFKKPNIKPKDPVDYSIHINLSNGRTFKATNEADWVAVDFQSFKGEITKEHLVRIRQNNRLFGGGRSLITDSKNGKSGTLNFPRAQKFDPPYVEVWIVRINEEDDVKKEVTVSNVLRVELP